MTLSFSRICFVTLFSSLLSLHCVKKTEDTNNDSEVQFSFSIPELRNSTLKQIAKNGSIKFFIRNSKDPEINNKAKEAVKNAANEWNEALSTNESWPQKPGIQVVFLDKDPDPQSKETNPQKIKHVTLDLVNNKLEMKKLNDEFYGEDLKQYSPTGGASFTEFSKRIIHIDVEEFKKKGNKLVTHEFGHILGLLDTYVDIKDRTQTASAAYQMKSMMKGNSETLTKDDVEGISLIWSKVDDPKYKMECPPGFTQNTNELLTLSYLFVCYPAEKTTEARLIPTDPKVDAKPIPTDANIKPTVVNKPQPSEIFGTVYTESFTYLKSSENPANAEDKKCSINARTPLYLKSKPKFVPPLHYQIEILPNTGAVTCARTSGLIFATHLYGQNWKEMNADE